MSFNHLERQALTNNPVPNGHCSDMRGHFIHVEHEAAAVWKTKKPQPEHTNKRHENAAAAPSLML